jgi:hypothetical protein
VSATLPTSAVNFLATIPGLLGSTDEYEEAVNNACLDARAYAWPHVVMGAIREELAHRFGAGQMATRLRRLLAASTAEDRAELARVAAGLRLRVLERLPGELVDRVEAQIS